MTTLPEEAVKAAINAWFEETRPHVMNTTPLPEQARRMRLALTAAIPFMMNAPCGYIVIKTQKTKTDLHIPILPPLMESIKAANIDGLLFLPAIKGGQWRAATASTWFGRCCDEVGVPGSAHGLRKAGATIAAENGATPHELAAMYGWASTQMAEVYTKKADKNRLAERAANKLFPNQ